MWILTLIAFFIIPILPTLILYLWKLRKYKNSWLMLLSIYALQAVLMVPIGFTMNANLRVAAAALGVMVFFMAINFMVNIILCPVLYFLCINPDPRRKKMIIISFLFVFLAILLLLFSDRLLTKFNFKNNINLYGKLENVDGSPIKNATIYFRNMSNLHFKENPIITNEKGIFNVHARSQRHSFLQINKIDDSESDSHCKLSFHPSFYNVANEYTMANLTETSKNNPMIALCWHDVPDNITAKNASFVFTLNNDQQKHHLMFYSDENCQQPPEYRGLISQAQYKKQQQNCYLNLDVEYQALAQKIVITSSKQNMQKYDSRPPYKPVLKNGYQSTVEYEIPNHYLNSDDQDYLIFKIKDHYVAIGLELMKYDNNTVRGTFRALGFYKPSIGQILESK